MGIELGELEISINYFFYFYLHWLGLGSLQFSWPFQYRYGNIQTQMEIQCIKWLLSIIHHAYPIDLK